MPPTRHLARLLGPIALATVCAIVLAGCGGSKPSNGESSKPAKQILKDAQRAVSAAHTVHASGQGSQGGQTISLDFSITNGVGGVGKFELFGGTVRVIRLGNAIYLRGDEAFWNRFGTHGIPLPILTHRWIEGPSTDPTFGGLGSLLTMPGLESKLAVKGKVVNDGVKTFDGQQAIALRVPSEGGTIYVSATGKPYPIAISGGKTAVTISFDHWNEQVPPPSKPENPYTVLGG